jgi:MFS family permease
VSKIQIDRVPFLVGLVLFLACLGVRLIGVGWGLPSEKRFHSYHPDEEIVLMYSSAVKPALGQFTPGFYNYGTFFLTVQSIVSDVVTGYGGGPSGKTAPELAAARGRMILAGRIVNCFAGALAALAVYLALMRHSNLIGAGLGGLACGLTPGMVVHSRFLTVDVLAAALLAVSFLFISRIVPKESEELDLAAIQKAAIWASVFAGLSAGTKYTGVLAFVAIAVVLAWVLGRDRRSDAVRLSAISLAIMGGVFVLVTPGVILDSAKFLEDFRYEMAHTSTGHGLVFAATSPGWIYHVSNLIVGYGGILLLLSLGGVGYGIYRRQPYLIGPAVFGLLIYVLIGRAEVKFLRYVFPLIPVLAMGFGYLIGEMHRVNTMKSKIFVALGIAAMAGFGGGFVSTANMTQWMVQPDVRDQMADYVRENLPKGSTIGLVKDPWFYSPSLHPGIQAGPAQARIEQRLGQLAEIESLQVGRYVPMNIEERQDWDLRLFTESKPDYVVFSSFEYEGLERIAGAKSDGGEFKVQFDQYQEFMEALKRDYSPIPVVRPDGKRIPVLGLDGIVYTGGIHDLDYIRPQLWIWKRNDSTTLPSDSSTNSGSSAEPATTR